MKPSNLQLHYDFTGVNSTIIPDAAGNGYAGVIRNQDAGGATAETDCIYGKTTPILRLSGGTDGGYLQLPNGALQNAGGLTVAFWCCVRDCVQTQTLLSFGRDQMLYLSILPDPADSARCLCSPAVTAGGQSQETALRPPALLRLGRWYHLAVCLHPTGRVCFFQDGKPAGACQQSKVGAQGLAAADCCLVGSGLFGAPPVSACLADFRIYSVSLSSTEIAGLVHVDDTQHLSMDAQALADLLPEKAEHNLRLPVLGSYGSHISYISAHPAYLTNDGTIHRSPSQDVRVRLTARLQYGMQKLDTSYILVVSALPGDRQIIEHDAAALSLASTVHICANLTLPDTGGWGSHILWSSSDPSILRPDGMVFRPAAGSPPVFVKLTATLSHGTAQLQKTFPLRILPIYKRQKLPPLPPLSLQAAPSALPTLPREYPVNGADGGIRFEPVLWETPKSLKNGAYIVNGVLQNFPDTPVCAEVTLLAKPQPIQRQAKLFGLNDTALLGENRLTHNFFQTLHYLELLDADRMLYNFRTAFSEDTHHTQPIGGWEEPMGLLRGHSTGHLLSALALAYGATGKSSLKNKLDVIVRELARLQQQCGGTAQDFQTVCTPDNAAQSRWSNDPARWGKGYISAYPPDQFALLEQFTPYATIWAPYYTLHKLLAGLLDCAVYAHSKTALDCACALGDWVEDRLAACSEQQLQKMWSMHIAGEYGGINESFARLARLTGKKKYMDVARLFDNRALFDRLSRNQDVLCGLHANQHIPQLIGALEEYEAGGDRHYYDAARYCWHLVVAGHSYSIGGVGRGEMFKQPGQLAANIESDRNCETCATYNLLKLTLRLFCYEPQAYYMDYYERALFNHIAASLNPDIAPDMHHGVTYMLPIGPGARREYGTDYHTFTCCHGTGMENHVKYQLPIYIASLDDSAVYINLYIPSRLRWQQRGITITQQGGFPSEHLRVSIQGAGQFTCFLRVPRWCKQFQVAVNGLPQRISAAPSSYIALRRHWQDGDVLELSMPFSLHLDYTPDKLDLPVASVLYGPLVMVAEDARTSWITLTLSPQLEESFQIEWQDGMPVLLHEGLRLIPSYAAVHTAYHTYFKIHVPYG